jgi:hypothetical protein
MHASYTKKQVSLYCRCLFTSCLLRPAQSRQNLRRKNESLRVEAQDGLSRAKAMLLRLASYQGGIRLRMETAVGECEELRLKYQKECLQRKLLYNKIQEMRGLLCYMCSLFGTCLSMT